jgi:hypothetical protein
MESYIRGSGKIINKMVLDRLLCLMEELGRVFGKMEN